MTWPRDVGGGLDGGQQQLPLAGVRRGELGDRDHRDQLVELLHDLVQRGGLDVDHDGDAAEALVVGGRDGQAEDVVAAAGEQPGHPGEHPGLVLHQHGEGVVALVGPVDAVIIRPPPGSATGRHDVVVGGAGRHHREDLLEGVGAEVDDHRTVVDRVGLVDGRGHLLGRLHPDADAAHGLGPPDVVGQVGREVHLRVPLLVEHLLPLADHAEVGVVQDGDLDRDALGAGGDQLLGGHLEAAVAVDRPDHLVGTADLGADGRGTAKPIVPEAAGVDPGVGVVEPPPLRGAHLVLADAGGDDGVVGRVSRSCSRTNCGLSGRPRLLVVDEREPLLPRAELGPPGQPLAGTAAASGRGGRCPGTASTASPPGRTGGLGVRQAEGVEREQQLLDDQPAVAGDGDVGPADLVGARPGRCRRG